MKYKFILMMIPVFLLTACQSTMLSDDRIASNTAGLLGVSPQEVTITDRRQDGPTNTYYIASTKKGKYACFIYGGGLLAAGMTTAPSCTKK